MKVVIPLSGGMDSAYLLYKCINDGYEPFPLIFDDSYGNATIRDKTIKPAIRILQAANLARKVEIIPFFPTNVYKKEDGYFGYTPGRNLSLVMAALSYGEFVGANQIWLGFNASQEDYYNDQRLETFQQLASLYEETYHYKIDVLFPIADLTRTEVLLAGTELGVPFKHTVSCIETPLPINCGRCERCLQRKQAYIEAGIKDDTLYLT